MSESTEKVVPMNDAIEKVTAHFESLATWKREVKEWGLTTVSYTHLTLPTILLV